MKFSFEYDVEAAALMADKEWMFALNMQMKPLPCVIAAVHLLRDSPRFDIDFNVDSGMEGDDIYHTRLQNVEARFLYRKDGNLDLVEYAKDLLSID